MSDCKTEMAITACMLIIGVIQGILAVIISGLSCKSLCCIKSPYPGNVLYTVPNNQNYPNFAPPNQNYPNFAPPNYQQSAIPVQNVSGPGLPEVGNLGSSGGKEAMNYGASRDHKKSMLSTMLSII